MENAEEACAGGLLLGDEVDHHLPVHRVERGGGLVQQQEGLAGDEAARHVHPLLLAAGEGGRRQAPQSLRQIEARQKLARLRPCRLGFDAFRDQRLGHHIEGGDARDDAQELAHIADAAAAQVQHLAGGGMGHIDRAGLVHQPDGASVGAVIAIDHLEDGALAGAGRAAQRHAGAGAHLEARAIHHRQAGAAAQMQREGLGEAFHPQQRAGGQGGGQRCRRRVGSGVERHAASTEETRSWV